MTEYVIVWDSGVPEGTIYRDLDVAKAAREDILKDHIAEMRDYCHIAIIGGYVDLNENPVEVDHHSRVEVGYYTDGQGNDFGWQDSTFPNER